jgi:hypothetical protein
MKKCTLLVDCQRTLGSIILSADIKRVYRKETLNDQTVRNFRLFFFDFYRLPKSNQ